MFKENIEHFDFAGILGKETVDLFHTAACFQHDRAVAVLHAVSIECSRCQLILLRVRYAVGIYLYYCITMKQKRKDIFCSFLPNILCVEQIALCIGDRRAV